MAVSDQEIDQLYAARYRLDQLFQNSPEFQDSLENSSAANSPSGQSRKSQRSEKSHRSHRSHDQTRTSRQKGDHHSSRHDSGHSPRGSPHRREDSRRHKHSPAASSPRWPQQDGVPKSNSGSNTPKDETVLVRRPQPLMQPGFSYLYPNVDGNAPIEKIPVRRYSFLGPSTKHITDTALPFKGKLEYFDRLSRGSTPEPTTPFSYGHKKVSSPLRPTPLIHHIENKSTQHTEGNSTRFEPARPTSLAKLQLKHPDSLASRHSQALERNIQQSGNTPNRSPADLHVIRSATPPQMLSEERLSRKNRSPSETRKIESSPSEPLPVHRRHSALQSSDKENRGISYMSPVPFAKLAVYKDYFGEDQASDGTGNMSRISSFAEIKKNEQMNSRHQEDDDMSRSFSASIEIDPETGRRHLERMASGSSEGNSPSVSKSKLQRHVSSPAIHISRKSLAVGQSKISDSVNQITDSMSQLRRSLSKRVGRSVSRSISKSISRSLAKKYKRQYNDELNDDDQETSSHEEQKKKPTRPSLSDTFSTLKRSHAFNHSGKHYQMLFGDTGDKDQRGGKDQGSKNLSDIHRFFHSQDAEGDSKSQKSHKSSSLPHPIDASVREEVSLREKHPEKFWTFTTSVVLPDYEPKQAYPDHPERDSLDGHLPGSSHGTGNPPPPPSPPTPPAASTKPGNGFTKGPNAKNKKHKKLKNETDEPPAAGDLPEKEKKKDKLEKNKDRDMEAGGGYRPKTEPYTHLWVVMSGMYGKLVVLLMLAFCLTEVLDNRVLPFTFQGVFLMYLYVGSIVAIMCIYVSVIIDNCPSITASKENLTKHEDPEVGSITSFGTLKRAHISRSKTSRTSFYLRVGALVFGLGTLIFNGLEIAMHSTMKSECVKDIVFAHPILQALFTFLQMHFLFVNSEVIVEKFGQVARFGFMHLVATNIAIWIRMVVWESATVWIEDTYANKPLTEVPEQAVQVLRLYSCFQNNTLGRLWTDAQPYLFPFLVEYSLIAAAVTYIMWCNVGKEKLKKLGQIGKPVMEDSATLDKRGVRKGYWKVDCRSASKGLFLGLLCLVGGVVILIIFFVMKDQNEFKTKMFWICNGTQMIILSLSIIGTIIGFLQIPKLSVSTSKPLDLDRLLLSSTIIGVYIFAVFGMIVGGINYTESEYLATFCVHALLLLQVSLQDMLVAEASRRTCTSRYQMLTKPGRQVITFLLFANITLWILDTFMTHTSVSQQFQFGFYGVLAWGIISRISLPLLILYRFHSAVILVEIWKNTYRTKAD